MAPGFSLENLLRLTDFGNPDCNGNGGRDYYLAADFCAFAVRSAIASRTILSR